MKKSNLKGMKKGMSRNEMRSIKGAGCGVGCLVGSMCWGNSNLCSTDTRSCGCLNNICKTHG